MLLALLGEGASLKPTLKGHRRGFLIRSHLEPGLLRRRLLPRWGARILVLSDQGPTVAFLEPSSDYLNRALARLDAIEILRRQSEAIEGARFFSQARSERLRRLPSSLGRGALSPPLLLFSRLALRIEGLACTPRPDRQWLHLGSDFDLLWESVPLMNTALRPWQRQALSFLCQVSRYWRDETRLLGEKGSRP